MNSFMSESGQILFLTMEYNCVEVGISHGPKYGQLLFLILEWNCVEVGKVLVPKSE